MQNDNQIVVKEMLKSFSYLLNEALRKTTKIYDGIITSATSDSRKWNIKYNNEIHPVKKYGDGMPSANMMVKVIVPQGNQALAWFFIPGSSDTSGDGATFLPSVSEEGIISWTNDKGLPNPAPVDIKGPQGIQGERGEVGETGPQGEQGKTGPYFTPNVSTDGLLSWTNNGGLVNPSSVNIQGPKGETGEQGETGPQGPQGEVGATGEKGDTGPYFIPSVSTNGDLSWTNNGNLPNPEVVNIKGPQGVQGEQGIQGKQGIEGPYFTPSVSVDGILSWTNNGGLNNPTEVNIKGPQGETGAKGDTGSQGPQGIQGEVGPYFTPAINTNGDISWTNNGGLTNPETMNVRGPQGPKGEQGVQGEVGPAGATGPYYTPSVDASGNLSWTNNGGLSNPTTTNIMGPQGPRGATGNNGAPATINGVNTLTIETTGGLTSSQSGNTFTIDASNIASPYFSTIYNGTVSSSDWTLDGSIYYNQVSIPNITSTQIPIIIPQWTSNQDNEENAWNIIKPTIEIFDGYIRFYSTQETTTDVSFAIYYKS